jgi:uncharacterized protein (UPF0548 family)
MILLRAPTPKLTQNFLDGQQSCTFTYDCVGGTESQTFPRGYTVDRNRILLGRGEEAWKRAVADLEHWTMFSLDWCWLTPARPPVATGTVVAVAFKHFGFWSINSARIVYVIDESDRRAFAYGTLPGHSESGEERFQIERASDDSVYYDLLAFSRPRDLLPRLAKPLARHLQRRFVEQSQAAMKRATQ